MTDTQEKPLSDQIKFLEKHIHLRKEAESESKWPVLKQCITEEIAEWEAILAILKATDTLARKGAAAEGLADAVLLAARWFELRIPEAETSIGEEDLSSMRDAMKDALKAYREATS